MSQQVLVAGKWRDANSSGVFHAHNPATKQPLPDEYPVSTWTDCDAALDAAVEAAGALRQLPSQQVAAFLEKYAQRIEARSSDLVEMANQETALPKSPRLADGELPRTTNQLRQAAASARDGSWQAPIIDTQNNVRSCYGPIGPVTVFGPNNFPFAFGSVSGGDFAAAIAAGNPVIGKANSSHPGTTRLFAEEAYAAVQEIGLPPATVQLVYRTDHRDGERLVSDPRVGATGYTGSRSAGLKLKAAADAAGKPIYLELSSVNPVVILPGALRERAAEIAEELKTSGLMGTGQFCTSPGLIMLVKGPESTAFLKTVTELYQAAPVGTLLSAGVERSLSQNIQQLKQRGAEVLTGGKPTDGSGYCFANTVLQISAGEFLSDPEFWQTEAFGNASLFVTADDPDQTSLAVQQIEGNLTGCIYSDRGGSDDAAYDRLAGILRQRVGRLLNDKMPTGVAVSPAMNHGGPYPATGHPGFTAVGIPGSISRFAMLQCYDNVRQDRLPACLQDKNPTGATWRCVDGRWTLADITA